MSFNQDLGYFTLACDKLPKVFEKQQKKLVSGYVQVILKDFEIDFRTSALKADSKNITVNEIAIVFKCQKKDCDKKYQLRSDWDSVEVGKDLIFKVLSNEKICQHPEYQTTRYVRKEERAEIAKELGNKSIAKFLDAKLEAADKKLIEGLGNLQGFKTPDVIRKIKAENRSKEDLAKDPLLDLYEMAKEQDQGDQKFIQRVAAYPFEVQLFEIESLSILLQKRLTVDCIRVHIDASGDFVAKLDVHCPSVLNHVIVVPLKTNEENTTSLIFPIAEMITCDQRALAIELWLRNVDSAWQNMTTRYPHFSNYIVTDWSFANINAITKGLNLMTIKQYLQHMFEAASSENYESFKKIVQVVACSSHLTKNVRKDVVKCYPDKKAQNFVTDLVMEIMSVNTFEELDEFISNVLVLLKKSFIDKEYEESWNSLHSYYMDIKEESTSGHASTSKYRETEDDIEYKQIFKFSPFYKKYKQRFDDIIDSNFGERNPYQSLEFSKMLKEKYFAYLPLIAGPFLNNGYFGCRPNNGFVERHFGVKKVENSTENNSCLKSKKVGRYIRQEIKDHHARKLRIKFKIKTRRLAIGGKRKGTSIDFQQENWKGRSNSLYHSRKFAKVQLEKEILNKA